MKHINLIKSFYPNLSAQEKKIADYLFKTEDNISLMSLQELTKKIKVSEPTIVRFVKKIGFKGFPAFKLSIAVDESKTMTYEPKNYVSNIKENIKETIEDTFSLISNKDIEEAVDLINNSKTIYVYGVGGSGVAALEFQNRFIRFGKICYSIQDTQFQIMHSSLTSKSDVLVVISLSGETKELMYPVKIAKENGCKIISITNYKLSPLAKLSNLVLLTSAKERPIDGGSLISKIAQLYVIDLLATGYAIRNKKIVSKKVKQIANAIASERGE